MNPLRRTTIDVATAPLATREIRGNLTVTETTVTAWYVMRPLRWDWLPASVHWAQIHSVAHTLTALTGHEVHLRVTERPYPASVWAENLNRATRAPLPGWHANRLQTDHDAIQARGLANKEVFLGVDFTVGGGLDLGSLIGRRANGDPVEKIQVRIDEINHELAGGQHVADPASAAQVEWLMQRSIALGLPAPAPFYVEGAGWTSGDMAQLADSVEIEHTRMADTVKLRMRGTNIERYVTVLCMGRPPQHGIARPDEAARPWLTLTEELPFPVEWSLRLTLHSGEAVGKRMSMRRVALNNLIKEYDEHGLDAPDDLVLKAGIAAQIQSEADDSHPGIADRAWGYLRVAVSGRTEEEARSNAKDVVALYGRRLQWRVAPFVPGQYELFRSFIPGEPVGPQLYLRRGPIRAFTAGMPQAATHLGDDRGSYLGDLAGGVPRPVLFDPHLGPAVLEKSGLTLLLGDQGSGKSALMGRIAADLAERGIKTTLLDPSGTLASLTRIGHLRPYSRHLDLTDALPGALNPYSMVGDPVRRDYRALPEVAHLADPQERAARLEQMYRDDLGDAVAERKAVVRDVVRGLLPSSVLDMADTEFVIGDAIRAVYPAPNATLWDVVDALGQLDNPHGKRVANLLRDAAELPLARLYFPPEGERPVLPGVDEPTLLVITTPGLDLPATGVPRREWADKMRASVVAMNLSVLFSARRTYGGPRLAPKALGIDEAGQLGHWEAGTSFMKRLARDTRKYNLAALIGSQNTEDLIGTGDDNPGLGVANLASAAFVGRMHDHGTALNALRALGVPQDPQLAARILELSPNGADYREFVLADQSNQVGTVRVHFDHRPELLAALRSGVIGANDREEVMAR